MLQSIVQQKQGTLPEASNAEDSERKDPKHRRDKKYSAKRTRAFIEASIAEGSEQKEWIVLSYKRNLPLRRAEASVESPMTSQIQADEQQPTGPGKIPPQRIEDEVRSTGCERPRNTEKTGLVQILNMC